jgi:hypothetical protein
VGGANGTLASSRLLRLARAGAATAAAGEAAEERCELCGRAIPAEHRHVLDLQSRELRCACRACSLLFDREAAADGSLRLLPDRRLRLEGFRLDDATWEELRIPVDMAFFFHGSSAGRVQAFYPSPMGPTESLLGLEAWGALEAANPVLRDMAPDVEALLVNRARGARGHYLVPLEEPYRLVAVIRTRWRGFTGGREVWEELERFFSGLDRRCRAVQAGDGQASAAAAAEGGGAWPT